MLTNPSFSMAIYNLEYLQTLIQNQVEESLHLEYKSAGALDKQNDKTTEISKDVSAMANSDGGTIVYGIKEDQTKRFPECIDAVRASDFSKEWLEQIVNAKIQPKLQGVQIHPISIGTDHVVFVVEIPKSNTAHQAADKKYYKRFNFQSVAMEDYEIRDIFNRAKNPNIQLMFAITNNQLVVMAVNRGTVYAQYVNAIIRLPRGIVRIHPYQKIVMNGNIAEIHATNTVRDMVDPFAFNQVAKYYPPRYVPVLPNTTVELITINLQNFSINDDNFINWVVYSDNSNPVFGDGKIKDVQTRLLD